MLSIRPTLAIVLSLSSVLAFAEPSQTQLDSSTPVAPTITQNVSTPTAPTPVNDLTQLQAAGKQLQEALAALQQQSNQLQASLLLLNQQIEKTQANPKQPATAEDERQLELLRVEYLQAEDTLMALRQQETLLQTHMATLSQQLTQLPQALTPALSTAPVAASIAAAAIPAATQSPTTTPQALIVPPPLKKPSIPPKHATAHKPKQPPATTEELFSGHGPQDIKAIVLGWLQDPAIMLRVGGGFVALALLLLIILCWPKSQRKKVNHQTFSPILNAPESWNNHSSRHTPPLTADEKADLAPEYDFMGTDAAIPARLDLARAYIEMGKLVEARAALKPILVKGNAAQKQEALNLLGKIELADTHV